jgi:RHS repeat-associated protein
MRTIQTASETLTTRYFHTDHLGSISVISDTNGLVVERLSYDAWGKRRNPDGSDDTTGSITSQTTRGFTGEEELSVSGLVHLNGRVYDPLLARMTSADPTVTDPMNPQGWNRYSYVGNDPLAFTDPNGFNFFSSFFSAISNFFTGVVHAVTHFLQTNPIARAIVQIVAAVVIAALLPTALPALAASVISAAGSAIVATGLSGGNLAQILKAGAIAGATAFAFFEVGDLTPGAAHAMGSPQFDPAAYAENVAGHALVGCGSSIASGGSCGSGALSGAVGSALAPVTNGLFPNARTDLGQRIGGTIVEATAGGLASVAGGGKFANGAITGAFGYMFNDAMHNCSAQCGPNGADLVNTDPTSPWLEIGAALGPIGRLFRTISAAYDTFVADRLQGLPPDGVTPPAEGPFTVGPASRRSDSGQSLWDQNGGEWRYFREDEDHNPHWDYNPWNHATDQWQNVQIGGLPPVK